MGNIDKYRGCLLGGAAGDALGYAIEFDREEAIAARYGSRGIRDYQLDERGLAPFSDDTQMTLYTANSLLCSLAALSAQAVWRRPCPGVPLCACRLRPSPNGPVLCGVECIRRSAPFPWLNPKPGFPACLSFCLAAHRA